MRGNLEERDSRVDLGKLEGLASLLSISHPDSSDDALFGEGGLGRKRPPKRAGLPRVAGYEMVSMIGEGGMGVVWHARQLYPLRRSVAVKLIKADTDSQSILSRFDAERQTLALMDHENVARVYDAGVSRDGQPYVVMEFIKGSPITTYCEEQKLSTRQRLELFLQVCDALDHAHQKGVIHRDIKPSNVLVTSRNGNPTVKMIDFGIAKALQPGVRGRAGQTLTLVGERIGTPAYMSPEQSASANRDVDTRSDIYSLGVLLHEVLTGLLPYESDPRRQRPGDDKETPQPALRPELEWILQKAMRPRRDLRYRSPDELAQDIRAYLAGGRVSAAPPSTLYRLRKLLWYRRKRVLILLAVLLSFAAGLAAAVQFWHVSATRADAALESQRLEEEQALAKEDFELAFPSAGMAQSIQRLTARIASGPVDEMDADRLLRMIVRFPLSAPELQVVGATGIRSGLGLRLPEKFSPGGDLWVMLEPHLYINHEEIAAQYGGLSYRKILISLKQQGWPDVLAGRGFDQAGTYVVDGYVNARLARAKLTNDDLMQSKNVVRGSSDDFATHVEYLSGITRIAAPRVRFVVVPQWPADPLTIESQQSLRAFLDGVKADPLVLQTDGATCRGNLRLWLPPCHLPAAIDIRLVSVDDIPIERFVVRAKSDGISWASGSADRPAIKNWSFGYDHYRGGSEEKTTLSCMVTLPADPFHAPSPKVTRHRYVLQLSPVQDIPQTKKATTRPTRSFMQPLQLPVRLRIEGQVSGEVVWASSPNRSAKH